MLQDKDLAALVRAELVNRMRDERAGTGAAAIGALEKRIRCLSEQLAHAVDAEIEASGSRREQLKAKAEQLGRALDARRADLREMQVAHVRLKAAHDARFGFGEDPAVLLSLLDGPNENVRPLVERVIERIRFDAVANHLEIVVRLRRQT
jgi:hypothetical protein